MKTYWGFSSTQHDSAIAIVNDDGELVFAEANERPLKNKRAWQNVPDPVGVIEPLLKTYAPEGDVVAALSWSDKGLKWSPLILQATLGKKHWIQRFGSAASKAGEALYNMSLRQAMYKAPSGNRDVLLNLEYRLFEKSQRLVSKTGFEHHSCHAMTGAITSPFDEALVAVIDGIGEGTATAVFRWSDGALTKLEAGPSVNLASLGFFYSQVTWACGFDPLGGEEWKLMGLAPYGKFSKEYDDLLRPMVSVDGSDLRRSKDYHTRGSKLIELRSKFKTPWEAADLAFTAQKIFEDVLALWLQTLKAKFGGENLILTGGCALNSSANGLMAKRSGFKNIHIPMAPGDDGNAIGAAFLAWQKDHPGQRPKPVSSAYLGSRLSEESIRRVAEFGGFEARKLSEEELISEVSAALADGKIVGWAQGRAEFGPRALGNRSILADPRGPGVKDKINAKVKFREEFRPFAPSILSEKVGEYFKDPQDSPYMERTLEFADVDAAPAVVHVNGTGRLQSLKREANPRYYALIEKFAAMTGVPILLNTSFNVMGRPIVHDVEDCVGVFVNSGLDMLVMETCVLRKRTHPPGVN